ncbi:MAG: hypothetical protein L0099_05175 [Acidobacteria bacterium]|nr:hypothetical protein [Acidobacteriota bacterium]
MRSRPWLLLTLLLLVPALPALAAEPSAEPAAGTLDHGYRLLYNLEFAGAQQEFTAWQKQHPDDPLGPVSEAAGLLFSEFHRLGILEAQFYADDESFETDDKLAADPEVRKRFFAALARAQAAAKQRLAKDAKEAGGLLAMTLFEGLQADYLALVEKKNFKSLGHAKKAKAWAAKLLAVDPMNYDAYLATGTYKYIIGSLPAPVRWLLRFGGHSGDKEAGRYEVMMTAEHGRFLKPFARILLAISYLRDKDKQRARTLLAGLRDEFPRNPLFAREIARLDGGQ